MSIHCSPRKLQLFINPKHISFQEKEVVVTKTPYGGLIVWTLPGGSVLFCHLKEKAVIRNKKRWSQCMYFLYFLGHPRLPTRCLDQTRVL